MEYKYTLMEIHHLFSFPIFISLLLFTVMVTKSRNESKSRNSKLPPGPWKLPIIGNLHQLMGGLPHQKLRRLSNIHGPLIYLKLGEVSIVVISSPEVAVEVLKNHGATFASRPKGIASNIMSYNQTDMAFAPYGAYWRQLRKICTSAVFTVPRVKSLRDVRVEEVSDFIKSISLNVGEPINLTQKIFSLNGSIVSRAAFGKKTKEQDQLLSINRESFALIGGFNMADLFPSVGFLSVMTGMKGRLEHLHDKADKILENIINEHKVLSLKSTKNNSNEEAAEDLIDVLLKYTGHVFIIADMFAGGTDTVSTTVEWSMAELIINPSVMARAQAEVRRVFDVKGKIDESDIHELHYLKLVIKEVLRLHPPAPLLSRQCEEKCNINGYEIPVKTKVIINGWALARDPNYWNDPDIFSPERFQDCLKDYRGGSFEYIPFGAGRRICPGITFALASVELTLAELLYHFDWKLPDGMKHDVLDMAEKFGLAVKRKQDLVLIPAAHLK